MPYRIGLHYYAKQTSEVFLKIAIVRRSYYSYTCGIFFIPHKIKLKDTGELNILMLNAQYEELEEHHVKA